MSRTLRRKNQAQFNIVGAHIRIGEIGEQERQLMQRLINECGMKQLLF